VEIAKFGSGVPSYTGDLNLKSCYQDCSDRDCSMCGRRRGVAISGMKLHALKQRFVCAPSECRISCQEIRVKAGLGEMKPGCG
jgi:hypothetical protein